MTVNTSASLFSRQATPVHSGQRLYLREDELDAGLARIFDANAAIKRATRTACAALGINWTQARALVAMARAPLGVQALSSVVGLTKQATIKTVEELEKRDLVKRIGDPKDGRRKTLVLSSDGDRIAREVSSAMRGVLAAAYRQAGGEAVAGCDLVLAAVVKESRA